MEEFTIAELVDRLGSDEDAVRKMAVFKLQSDIGDPSFADVFIIEGGLSKLRYLVLHSTQNTLSYSLASFSKLLEVDKGWESVDMEMIERVVELVVTHPLVNILRGAMSILVAIVSRPHNLRSNQSGNFGFRALKPAIGVYPQFLEMLVSRLSSADYGLCANSLQLINSLMRDAITNDSDQEWPKFIKRLQDLGVIKNVYVLMQSSAIQDLAQPLIEFQNLTKVLLKKWREIRVDLEKQDHRRALKGLHLASNPERPEKTGSDDVKRSRRHNPEKWRRLGFETESPAWEFEEVGFLGMMDLTDFVKKEEDGFQKILLEQSSLPASQRCPIARASLAVTLILYDHFEIASSSTDATAYIALDSRTNIDKLFHPLLLQWSRLHTASLQAFLRLWKATGSEMDDFNKIDELVRILVEQVAGYAPRTADIAEIEDELDTFDYKRLRELQMELLELGYEEAWGHHLRQVRDELRHEALQFVKEQRIRCLLKGAWFGASMAYRDAATNGGPVTRADLSKSVPTSWRFVKLSHNRRWLHWQQFDRKGESDIGLDALGEKIDLSTVTSVVSNVSSSLSPSSSTSTLRGGAPAGPPASNLSASNRKPRLARSSSKPSQPATEIIIHGPSPSQKPNKNGETAKEAPLLTLHPSTTSLASEWLDGLLMLLSQAPITSETAKLVDFISVYGLKIRLLNVRFDDALGVGAGSGGDDGDADGEKGDKPDKGGIKEPEVPSREGLDEDYYYDVFGGS